MDFLITGATGFIGTKLVNALLARGDAVNYLARKRSDKIDGRAAFHSWDGESAPPLNSIPRLDAIIHLMGEPIAQRWTPQVKERIRRSRIDSTRNLVAALRGLRHKPSVLVSGSAVGYYGNRGDEVLTELAGPGSGFLADVCVEWENEALLASELGLRVVNVRTSTVLGREGGALPKMATPFRWGVGGRFGSGQQWISWVHIDDLIRLLLFAADEKKVSGPLNGASPQPVKNEEFTRILAKVLGRPALLPVPRFALNIALGEMASFLFDSLRVIPAATEKAGFQFKHGDLTEALTTILK